MRLFFWCDFTAGITFQSTHPKRDETFEPSNIFLPTRHFNPLIPNGMRHLIGESMEYISVFQSTHPKRDETVDVVSFAIVCSFQSTHPKRDETLSVLVVQSDL